MVSIELGMIVKDTVTDFQGKVIAIAHYLYSETQILVASIDTTGRPIEWWFDETRLVIKGVE